MGAVVPDALCLYRHWRLRLAVQRRHRAVAAERYPLTAAPIHKKIFSEYEKQKKNKKSGGRHEANPRFVYVERNCTISKAA